MKVTFAALADTVIRDADRNTLTLLDLLDGIDVPVFPAVLPRLSACFIINREDGDGEEENLMLRMQSGAMNNTFPVRVSFNEKRRSRVIVRIEGFVIFQPGPITATLEKDDVVVGSYSFDATAAPRPPATGAVAG
ncbi:DUF6941 family protein [Burkholderia multivorans]|uniref:DUF6941 family protein n=1 Tax=Burkholderia multivorans TaxID=87883 RepID=UPI0012D87BD6|nr:hypothetical protein [Burkholderia multivorans]MBU9252472.1 hypothetical protein [Burkholderia multivorans]MBU9257614.1 hypothetical protein [Burkholderia multivorans]MDN7760099.1 hypothetical protein [Burkholderia multivorans]MDN8100286.1 hypothetical protein [Burkholderia multivorans]